MKKYLLIPVIFVASLLAQYCADGTDLTLSSLGLTGTFRYTDSENGSTHCRVLQNFGNSKDNISQSYTVEISDTAITIANTIYDNNTANSGADECSELRKLYTVSQTFNVVSIGSSSTAIAIDNNSATANTTTTANSDNYTTRLITGTVGATTVTCWDEGSSGNNRGCALLKSQQFCGMGTNGWDNATTYTVNGSFSCYISDKSLPEGRFHPDNITKMAGILLDNDTLQVPAIGTTKHLTIGYFDNGTSKRHISFREFNGPNTLAGAESSTNYGTQTHTAFYFNGGAAQDNITAYWGGADNLSNRLVTLD